MTSNTSPFGLAGPVAVVPGGDGVLGGSIASGLAAANAGIAVLGRRRGAADEKADEIRRAGGEATVLVADVRRGATESRARRDPERVGARGHSDGRPHHLESTG